MSIQQYSITWSIRGRQLLLLSIILLPALGIVVFSGVKERRHHIETAQDKALILAQSLAAQQEQLAASTREMLSTLAQLPEVQTVNIQACNDLFRELYQRSSRYSIIGLVTPEGNLIAASTLLPPDTVNIADRKPIRDAIRTRDFSAGEYIVGRVSNVQSFNYAYPVFNAERNLAAIVVAGIKLEEVTHFLSQVTLPENASVGLADHRGMRLLRMPEHEKARTGKPIPDEILSLVSGTSKQGIFDHVGEDGIQRFYAFKRLRLREDTPPYMYLFVGLSKAAVIHQANAQMMNNLIFLGLTTLLAAGMSWVLGSMLVAKPLKCLVAASKRFGQGEISVRTGWPHSDDEFGRMAKAFDEMATQLELREKDRIRQESALQQANTELETRVMERTAALSAAFANLEQQDEALRKSMEKYRGIFDESITTIYLFDTNKKFIDANQAGLDLLGYSREELLQMHIPDVDADPVVVLPAHQELLAGGRIIDYEHRLRRKDGTILTVLNNSRALTDAHGNVIGMLSTLLDITERKRAEDELRQAHTLIDMIVENIPNMIFLKDAEELRFIRFNKAGEMLLGYPREVLLGKNDYDFFPKTQADFFTEKDREVLFNREVVDIPEESLETRDKGTRILHTKKVPLLGINGEAEYLLGISEDITDRKRAEESLRHTLEEKISLLKEVHHRVKNNLQIVTSLLSLQVNRSQSPEVCSVLRDMGNRVHSMALLHEILYRSDDLALIHLKDYVEGICAQLQRSSGFEDGRVKLESDVENISLPMEHAVPYALIVNELVSNTLKHAFPGGRSGNIRVSTRLKDDGQIRLNVTDDGIGIPSGDDPSRKPNLGLQLVSRLARQLGGQMTFARGDACGVCFSVDFPAPTKNAQEHVS